MNFDFGAERGGVGRARGAGGVEWRCGDVELGHADARGVVNERNGLFSAVTLR